MDKEKRFISMLSDYGRFGLRSRSITRANPEFIKRALQALIASDTPVREVKFIRNKMSGTTKYSRGGLFDMSYKDELGRASSWMVVPNRKSYSPAK